MKISGTTQLIAHLGFPTESFKAPLIYNPYFAKHAIDAVVVPMGCRVENYRNVFSGVTRLSNFLGALITMPHKVSTVGLLDEVSTTVKVAGSCNAVRRTEEGKLIGDMFDGEGFVRGLERHGRRLTDASVRVIGCGGVGAAISASVAKAGVARLGVSDTDRATRNQLCDRLQTHYPHVELDTVYADSSSWDVIVNATPLGMKPDDPLPMDLAAVPSSTLIGDVVLTQEVTPFLEQARSRGCDIQIGLDMLFEQIPAYLEFFRLGTTTSEELRAVAQI